MPACPTTPTSSKDTPLHIRIKRKHEVSPLVQNGTPMGPTPMGATPMGSTPKSAQKAYEVKNFHEFTEVPNDEGNKRISLVSIVSNIFMYLLSK